jgi:hypothetical protein
MKGGLHVEDGGCNRDGREAAAGAGCRGAGGVPARQQYGGAVGGRRGDRKKWAGKHVNAAEATGLEIRRNMGIGITRSRLLTITTATGTEIKLEANPGRSKEFVTAFEDLKASI